MEETIIVGVHLDLSELHGDMLECEYGLIMHHLTYLHGDESVSVSKTEIRPGVTLEIFRKEGMHYALAYLAEGLSITFGVKVATYEEGRSILPSVRNWFIEARLPMSPERMGVWTRSFAPSVS